ncbi:unnamed protein product, partial [Closterium sp. Yama58-4]
MPCGARMPYSSLSPPPTLTCIGVQVGKLEGEEGGTAWTTGIAEVQLPIDYKLSNIEATEEAKRMLQERRPFMNRPRPPSTTLPASYSADFFQRGREYAEKLKR